MRRARFKVAPNIGLSSRLPKPSEQLNVVESKPQDVISTEKDESTIQESSVSVTVATFNDVITTKQPVLADALLPSVEASTQPQVTPMLVLEGTPVCPDKENIVAEVIEEPSNEVPSGMSVDEQVQSSGVPSSRYKPRNKIRPVIKDAPHRIRTFSSASESEDDAGKRQPRTPLTPVRKSPVKKDVTLETASPALPKESSKKGKKKERTPLEIKKAAMRKKLSNGTIERSQLTMFDLIYYNPIDGERPPEAKEKLKMRPKPYEIEALQEKDPAKDSPENPLLEEMLAEEEAINKMEEDQNREPNTSENKEKLEEIDDEEDEEESMPVPQVRLGPDGEIIIDDQSLVIDTSQTKKNKRQLASAPIVVENSSTLVNYGSWRKKQRSARWSLKETARFYRALSMLGTNFSLMEKLFHKRPRVELKRKFKTEEKINPQLVDKIISQQIPFDPSQFMDLDDESSDDQSSVGKKTKKGKSLGKKKKAANIKETDGSDSALTQDLETSTKKVQRRKKESMKNQGDETNTTPKISSCERKKPAQKRKKASNETGTNDEENIVTKKRGTQSPGSDDDVPVKRSKNKKHISPSLVDEDSSSSESAASQDAPIPCSSTVTSSSVSDETVPSTSNSATALDSLLKSPLGMITLEQGGITLVEDTNAKAPSFLVPPALAEANPAIAQAEPGSLVLVTEPNPDDPNNQMVHVYRIAASELGPSS